MLMSSLLHLDNIEVAHLSISYAKSDEIKNELLPEDIEFKFKIQCHQKSPLKRRLIFNLKTIRKEAPIFFEIDLFYEFSFLKETNEEDEGKLTVSAVLPQIFSFARGYLYAATEKGPSHILLPSVNIIESMKKVNLKGKPKKSLEKK